MVRDGDRDRGRLRGDGQWRASEPGGHARSPVIWPILAARPASRICASCPGGVRGSSSGVLDGLPGQSHARACLLDHAAKLRDGVEELLVDEQVGVELAKQTLERASPGVDGRARLARGPASRRRLQAPALRVGAGGAVAPVGGAGVLPGAEALVAFSEPLRPLRGGVERAAGGLVGGVV